MKTLLRHISAINVERLFTYAAAQEPPVVNRLQALGTITMRGIRRHRSGEWPKQNKNKI